MNMGWCMIMHQIVQNRIWNCSMDLARPMAQLCKTPSQIGKTCAPLEAWEKKEKVQYANCTTSSTTMQLLVQGCTSTRRLCRRPYQKQKNFIQTRRTAAHATLLKVLESSKVVQIWFPISNSNLGWFMWCVYIYILDNLNQQSWELLIIIHQFLDASYSNEEKKARKQPSFII
jgi:hypothetical protein